MTAALIVLVVLCAVGALAGLALAVYGLLEQDGPPIVIGGLLVAASIAGLVKIAGVDAPTCRPAPAAALPEETAK